MLWVITRTAAAIVLLLAAGDPLMLPVKGSLIIVAVVGLLTSIDVHRHNEDVFLANLGTSKTTVAILGLAPPLVLEVALRVVAPS